MLHHAVDVFEHIAASDLEQVQLAGGACFDADRPAFQGLSPALHGGALVFAQRLELMQGGACLQQRVPARKTGAWAQQFGLPVVELATEFATQVQVTVDHLAEDAQHHVGRAGRNATGSG